MIARRAGGSRYGLRLARLPPRNRQIRAHWSIENSCHWVLDVVFGEDDSRIRVGHGAENFAVLRRMILNLINQNKTSKGSKKSKRHLAAWSTSPLQTLVGLQTPSSPAIGDPPHSTDRRAALMQLPPHISLTSPSASPTIEQPVTVIRHICFAKWPTD